MSKLLALDQASKITGYAIYEENKLISYGKIIANQTDVGQRLVYIRNEIQKLIIDNNITEVIMEDIQLQGNVVNNVQTFKTLAEVFGVIYELLTEMKIPNSAVLSVSWKSAIGVKGRSRAEQKKNAQKFALDTYNVKATEDECDAICIGHYAISKRDTAFDWSE